MCVSVVTVYSKMSVYVSRQLSAGVVKLRGADVNDVNEGLSSAAMHTALMLLLRYQRLLVSKFIASDKLLSVDNITSLSGFSSSHFLVFAVRTILARYCHRVSLCLYVCLSQVYKDG